MLRFQLDTTGNLLKDLIAFWPLDELGGQRRDMLGYNPLTDNNTVTSAKGIGGQGTAAKFTSANSEYLSVGDNPQLSTGDIDFTVTSWVYLDSKSSKQRIISKWDSSAQAKYNLHYDNTPDRFRAEIRNDPTENGINADVLGAVTTGRWYFAVMWHDSTNDRLAIQIDNLHPNFTSTTIAPLSGTSSVRVGAVSSPEGSFWDGRIAYVGFWKRVLSQQERTDLYNFGRGNRLITY